MALQFYIPKISIFVLLLSLLISLNLKGQEFTDKIFKLDGDTIHCKITLVNDQNIFYQYKKEDQLKQM
jgi:hypothetical protein